MKLEYSTIKDDDLFVLTNFNCEPAQDLFNKKGLFKIVWSKEKCVNITIDGYLVELKKDEVIFCTPFNVMNIDKSTEGLTAFVFNKEFFCIQTHDEAVSCNGFLFFGSSQPQIISLNEKEKKIFSMMLFFFDEEFMVNDHVQGEMLRTLLKKLLILSTRIVKKTIQEPTLPNAQMEIIRQYNLLVEAHFRTKHKVKDFANLLFKSPKTLSNFFKKYNEKSPLRIINDRILLEARRLLLYSNKTTEEIAHELGYKDTGHFSKFFKKNEGLSPTVFRTERRKIP